MHTDARTIPGGTLIEGDVCIIGAGAAGISMALEWIGGARKVILLEGGGFDVEAQMQDLYRGESIGQPYFPMEAARLHYFGGTTGHWAGFCSPYDPIDFEHRPWVPYSGWPIERSALDPFYARAQRVAELGPYEYGAAYWEEQDPDVVSLPLSGDLVWTKMWQFSPPTRFGTVYRDEIVNAPNVHLYTYANVTDVQANEAVTAVEGLTVKSVDGKEHRVRAKHYVLACGAIQNARVLLASNRQAPRGLGNAHDQVGRYFMEHVEITTSQLILAQPAPMKMYMWSFGGTPARGELALTARAQREHEVLNVTASLQPGTLDGDIASNFERFPHDAEAIVEQMDAMVRAGTPRVPGQRPPTPSPERAFRLFTRSEQSPNPASRITLSEDRDALGMPRARLDWQLSPIDKRSIRVLCEQIAMEVGRTGVGRVQLMDWLLEDDSTWPDFLGGGWHHMGTTRMHQDPRQGVVDPDSKVHGLGNLYVAGSSVYPTSGAANPTLTLIALTFRLSDHLKEKLA